MKFNSDELNFFKQKMTLEQINILEKWANNQFLTKNDEKEFKKLKRKAMRMI